MIKVEFDLEITKENIEDIVDTAGYGIGYWAEKAIEGKDTYEVLDSDEGWFKLTYEDIKRGVEKYVQNGHTHFLEFDSGKVVLDAAQIDASDADNIIQYACFGEIVYC